MEITFTVPHGDHVVYCSVSPCSWMYKGYGLQVRVTTKEQACNAESEFIRRRDVLVDDVPAPRIRELALQVVTEWLAANGVEPILKAIAEWAEKEPKLRAACEKEAARNQKARIKRLTKRKAEGCTHVMDAWIHPATGSDHMTEVCFRKKPTKADVARVLATSTVKTDYKVSKIEDVLASRDAAV